MKRNILLLFTFFACITVQGQTPVRLVDLRSEHLDRPIGLDNPVPRLSWRMEDGRQGAVQTSWRIVVDEDSLNVVNGCGRMWDSGKNDSRNLLVAYAGKKLQPFTRYYWKVICSDMEYKETASPVSYFETGMMGMQHWQGAWIGDGKDIHYGPAPYFRKEFKTGKKVKSARAYIAAAGLYELYINGEKIGDHCLAPLYTRFDRRNLYVAYDVTSQFHQSYKMLPQWQNDRHQSNRSSRAEGNRWGSPSDWKGKSDWQHGAACLSVGSKIPSYLLPAHHCA